MKKLKQSGAGRNDKFQTAKEELVKYSYLEWLKPFIAGKFSVCIILGEDNEQTENVRSPNSVDDLSNGNGEEEEKSNDAKSSNPKNSLMNIF